MVWLVFFGEARTRLHARRHGGHARVAGAAHRQDTHLAAGRAVRAFPEVTPLPQIHARTAEVVGEILWRR
jgi:hypothetical protein